MGTIIERPKKDGSLAYTATVRVKRDGKVVLSKSATFARPAAAKLWIAKVERDAAKPGGLDAPTPSMTLGEAITKYLSTSRKAIGRTKAQVLEAVQRDSIASMACDRITSPDLVSYATRLGESRQPQTVGNYMSHLGAVFAVASSAFGVALDDRVMHDAMKACKRLGLTATSAKRSRRPTIEELEALMTHFVSRSRRSNAMPMHWVVAFATFSTRRQDEITRLRWADLEPGRILVRDMKNPGEKIGNDVWCDLPPEAEQIARAMPRRGDLIFPFSSEAISANFTRACQLLGIKDLHFHDLRHEGASRLFEMGWTIPQAASVTGHKSWQSLQRYSHLRQAGDKLAEWKWREALSIAPLILSPGPA